MQNITFDHIYIYMYPPNEEYLLLNEKQKQLFIIYYVTKTFQTVSKNLYYKNFQHWLPFSKLSFLVMHLPIAIQYSFSLNPFSE